MKDHCYIYSYEGMSASIVGWILEQSPTYKSDNFKFSEYLELELVHKFWQPGDRTDIDPWDNHSDNPSSWTHAYIESIEQDNNDFSWMDNYVANLDVRTIFGLSYGAYSKQTVWKNPNCNIVIVGPPDYDHPNTEKYKKMFAIAYWSRKFDLNELVQSFDMHVHDHHGDNEDYRIALGRRLGNARQEAAEGKLEFWQLQAAYHHGYPEVPTNTPENKQKFIDDVFEEEIFSANSLYQMFKDDPDVIHVDLFNINIPDLCLKLNIEYSVAMTDQMEMFDRFCAFCCGEDHKDPLARFIV